MADNQPEENEFDEISIQQNGDLPGNSNHTNRESNGEVEGADDVKSSDDVKQNLKERIFGKLLQYPKAVPFILFNELGERFAYYGMRAILVMYFVIYFEFEDSDAVAYYHLFITFCYFSPLLGGYVADTYFGKYLTILLFSVVYCIGLSILAITAVPGVTGVPPHWWGVLTGLLLIALGTGGIKPCVSSFGGDQFERRNMDDEAVSGFFHIFYFTINVGSFVSILIAPVIREYVNFEVAFLVPAILLFIAVGVFFIGRKHYILVPPAGSQLGMVFSIIWKSTREWFKAKRRGEKDPLMTSKGTRKRFLDLAECSHSKEQIDDSHACMSALKIFIPLPVFWALYDQQGSRWVLQSRDMDRQMGVYVMPPSQMQAINALLILVLIPVFERVIYPFFQRVGFRLTMLRRIQWGMVLAALSFVISAIIQFAMDSSTVSVWWQTPQYVIITAAEVMCSITGLEFAYSQAPKTLKSVVMSFFLLTTALGDIIVVATAEMRIFSSSMGFDFLFFALLMLIFAALFAYISKFVTGTEKEGETYQTLEEVTDH